MSTRPLWLIYSYHALVDAAGMDWQVELKRVAKMGFTVVGIEPVVTRSMPSDSPAVALSSDSFRPFCTAAVNAGLVPMITVHTDSELLAYRQQGFAAFRCVVARAGQAGSIAGSRPWTVAIDAVRRSHPQTLFLLDALGASFTEVLNWAAKGFDAALDSGAWWDGSEPWYFAQREALSRLVDPVTLIDDPTIGYLRDRLGGANPGDYVARLIASYLWTAAVAHGVGVSARVEQLPDSSAFSLTSPDDDQASCASELTAALTAINQLKRRWQLFARPGSLVSAASPGGVNAAVIRRRLDSHAGDQGSLLVSTSRTLLARETILATTAPDFGAAGVAAGGFGSRWQDVTPRPAAARRAAKDRPDLDLQRDDGRDHAAETGLTSWWLDEQRTRKIRPMTAKASLKLMTECASRRIAIEGITPSSDDGRFPVKRMSGELLEIGADVFCDGHDQLAVAVHIEYANGIPDESVRMQRLDNDRWSVGIRLTRIGRARVSVHAWRDEFATWVSEVRKKFAVGVPIDLELRQGCAWVAQRRAASDEDSAALIALETALSDAAGDLPAQYDLLMSAETLALMQFVDPRTDLTRHDMSINVIVDRTRAVFGSWYELFPRSTADDPARHGNFDDVIARLPYVRSLGFDILYFPPIHPIGKAHRKGPNNSLTAAPGDPGSPYAIGASEGGHTAIHPELGSLDDFARLVAAAREHDLEIALDFAIQCSPDHPWIREHHDWFDWRPDGTLKYAENPPKKYEDITNVSFYRDGPVTDLWQTLRDVVLFWIDQGVLIFRVDNPHTKPFPFWEWLIADVQSRHPDAVFLAEAFSRPKVMARLAKVGFTQSYSYFTWRTTKTELTEYLSELITEPLVDVMRPNFFVNTPDINPIHLQTGSRAMFRVRAALAATLSPSWGMLAGYELCESEPLPGREEYLDSEKYQLRARDWDAPANIRADITRLNHIRRHNPALWQFRNLQFHKAWNDNVLVYSKWNEARDNLVLIAVNLDPDHAQGCDFEIPLWMFGLSDQSSVRINDLIHDQTGVWHGKIQSVWLDPAIEPVRIWRLMA